MAPHTVSTFYFRELLISENLINNDDVYDAKYHGVWCWKKGGFEKW